jgi:hypothetical protein
MDITSRTQFFLLQYHNTHLVAANGNIFKQGSSIQPIVEASVKQPEVCGAV